MRQNFNLIKFFKKYKGNIWFLNTVPVILTIIISFPFNLFDSLGFIIFTISLIILPIYLSIINYQFAIQNPKRKFIYAILSTISAVIFYFLLLFIPVLFTLLSNSSVDNKLGIGYFLILAIFSLILTFFLSLISYGFYLNQKKKDKFINPNRQVVVYSGTIYMIEYIKEILQNNGVDSTSKSVSLGQYELFVELQNLELANEIISKQLVTKK